MSRRDRQVVKRKAATTRGDKRPETGVTDSVASAGDDRWSWVGIAASVAVIATAFLLALHKLDDFDTWWHLTAGRWIAANHAVPVTDTLSHTVRDHPWIDVQWGFDLGLYLLHQLGGPVLLCVAAAIAFALTMAIVVRVVAAHVGAVVAALLGVLIVGAAQERVTLRPELASFVLLAAVLFVLDRARRKDGQGAFLLVPLMIVWVNVHALFAIGAFAMICALIGAVTKPPRRLAIWVGVALASVIINPYLFTGVLFPLKLLSRINGSNAVFQTVGEFGSPFAAGATGVSLVFYKVLLALGVLAALGALWSSSRAALLSRAGSPGVRFDWGGLIWFAALVVLSATARRNVALFAIGSAPFVARCLETVVAVRASSRTRLRRWVPLAAGVAILLAIGLGAAAVTGALYKVDNSPQEFGVGVIEGAFPIRAAAFARAAALPPTLFNDMGSGGYLAWDDPLGGGVYIDGRLEVYDTAFVTEYVMAVADPVRWQADADRYGVQTAIIFHRFENDRILAGRLFTSGAWSLVYADEVAAIFVRTEGNEAAIARAASMRAEWDAKTAAWLAQPTAKWPYPAGRIEGTRAYARFQATIGAADPAVAAYLKLVDLGIPSTEEIDLRLRMARYFASRGQTTRAQEQARAILAIDPANPDARRLLQ